MTAPGKPTPGEDWVRLASERCERQQESALRMCTRCGGREAWCDDCEGRDWYPDPTLVRALEVIAAADALVARIALIKSGVRMVAADDADNIYALAEAYALARGARE